MSERESEQERRESLGGSSENRNSQRQQPDTKTDIRETEASDAETRKCKRGSGMELETETGREEVRGKLSISV